jgi:hypothetical protein
MGLRSDAKDGRDALDFAQAPPVERVAQLSVKEKVGNRLMPHAGSFKPPEGDGRTWTLTVQSLAKGEALDIQLQFEERGTLPEGQDRYVLDLAEQRPLPSGHRLHLEGGAERQLKVIVGTKAYAKKESKGIPLERLETTLRGNYPNPFAEATTLEYVLEEESEVEITVYDVLGRRIRTLVRGTRDAGLHQVRWDGENRYGKPVGSGVYFYRFEAEDFEETRKMMLVR